MRISDWSSDVCSSDLRDREGDPLERAPIVGTGRAVDHYWLADVDTNAARRRPQAFHIAEEPGQRFGLLAPPGLLGGIFLDVADQVEAGDEGDEMDVPGPRRVRGVERSEERRVGKEGVSTWRSRWSP